MTLLYSIPPRSTALRAVYALSATVLVAACGGDDATDDTEAGDTTTTEAAEETTTTEAAEETTTTEAAEATRAAYAPMLAREGYGAVTTEILPAPEFQGRSGTNEYGDFCLHVDDTVGRVMQAFDPELRTLSPGNVMLSHLIERAINQGMSVFDFLKGDATYKFRLGARERPLYRVTAKVGT